MKAYGVSGSLLTLLCDFLTNRAQRVLLNGQDSIWRLIEAGVPQGSILGPLLFLIFINDLPINFETNGKIFADDTSLFQIVLDQIQSASKLNRDLQRISDLAYQWKMSFNPDPSKQAVEIHFSKNLAPIDPPALNFNGTNVQVCESHKHLGARLR